jgi:hypothetical protein
MAVPNKMHSPAYLWVQLSSMEKAIWAGAYANSKRSASERARVADRTVQSLRALEERREGEIGPEYEAARTTTMLEFPEFEAWYRVQLRITKGSSAQALSKDQCLKAFERYQMGLGDFY